MSSSSSTDVVAVAVARSSRSRNEDADKQNSSPSLTDFVFSWTLKDVFNEHLYKDKVQKIPKTFYSVEHYLSSYRYPLVEETHADLLSNMKSVSRWTPSCKILSVEEDKNYIPSKDLNYKMRLSSKKDSKNQEIYKPQLNDVIALSDVRPMSVNDLNRPRRTYFPAFVTGICVDGDSNVFQVLASRPIEFEQSEEDEDEDEDEEEEEEKESLFAMFLINMTTNVRIWRALSGGNASIIEEVLHADSLVGFSCDRCFQKVDCLLGNDLRDRLNSFSLNESQVDAVLGSFATSKCDHKNSVKLIWGPPGTGKTKTVGTLLWMLLMKKCKTLTCAPTNIAVVQVTSRLMSLVRQTLKHEGYGLGDIVLFGNEERMKIDDHDDLHDVFLNYRVDKLVECFSPLTGWTHQLHSMIWLLEDADQQYISYVENIKLQKEQIVAQNKYINGLKNTTCEEVLGFREFFLKHFGRIELGIIFCIRCCCTHLSTSFISVSVVVKMNRILSMLATLRTLLHDTRLTDGELQKIFSKSDSETNTVSYSSAFLLSLRRNECLKILKSLDEEFASPNFLEVNVKDFCLQNACLIFCTVSSSANLSALKTLELLIIDEAAQLKECDSTIPLQLPGVRHAILVGDERQLPAMVMSKISEKSEFGRSLFERLVLLGHPKHLLNVQYRMHPSISLFPNAKFYNKQISDAPNVQDRSYRCDLLDGKMYGPYSFIDVSYGKEESGNGRSQRNIFEVAVVSEIVENLFRASVAKRQKVTVGVISPYKAQVFALTEKLRKKYETYNDFSVSVRSVDGFQGGEEDVIIYSAVRSNQNGNVGFLSNHQRTNVALTRARYCLWILGSGATLINSDSVWKELVLDAKDRKCYFSVDDDKRLAKAIIDCMIELDQFEGLLTMNSPLFKEARWKVIFGDCFCKSMVRIKSLETRKEVVALMVKLLNGWRHNQTQKDMFWYKDGNSSQLLEQYKIDGLLNLLWTVDIRKANTKCIQVLKFWDILPSDKIPELAECVNGIFAKYSLNNRNRCNFKCREGILEVPMSWEVGKDSEGLKDINEITSGDLANQLASLSLGKERKFRPMSTFPEHLQRCGRLRTVGVVSPYKAQVFAPTEKLGQKYESYSHFSVSVRSVDGFQGGEEDVIIYSAVRSNQNGNVGFLSNYQRTNIALTRARYSLWILGNGSTLVKSDSVWKELVLDAKDRECYFSADDDKRLAKAIIDSMVELDQVDDLFNMNSPLFKDARWKVMFEDCFCKSMVKINNMYTRKEVVDLMVKLSNGWRHTEKQKDLIKMQGNSSELLEQYKIDSLLNLLWTVDICKENSKCIQVLRFWDILPSDKIPKMADHLDGIFGNYTFDNINRCKVKCHEGILEILMSWEIGTDDAGLKDINEINYGDLTNQLATLNLGKEFQFRGQSSRDKNRRQFKKKSSFPRKL